MSIWWLRWGDGHFKDTWWNGMQNLPCAMSGWPCVTLSLHYFMCCWPLWEWAEASKCWNSPHPPVCASAVTALWREGTWGEDLELQDVKIFSFLFCRQNAQFLCPFLSSNAARLRVIIFVLPFYTEYHLLLSEHYYGKFWFITYLADSICS